MFFEKGNIHNFFRIGVAFINTDRGNAIGVILRTLILNQKCFLENVADIMTAYFKCMIISFGNYLMLIDKMDRPGEMKHNRIK